jgi:hypothetical protein
MPSITRVHFLYCGERHESFPGGMGQNHRLEVVRFSLCGLKVKQYRQNRLSGHPILPSILLPAFTGRDFIATTESSATSHRFGRPWIAPCTSLSLPLVGFGNDTRLPRLRRTPCKQSHTQSRYGTDQVSVSRYFAHLPPPHRRIRFAYAMYRSLPIASFRPRRCK